MTTRGLLLIAAIALGLIAMLLIATGLYKTLFDYGKQLIVQMFG